MSSALRNSEQHDVVVSCLGDGGVLRPIIGEVMDCLPVLGLDGGFSDAAIRVVRRADELDAGVTIKCTGISIPAVERRAEVVCHRWVGLHTLKNQSCYQEPALLENKRYIFTV